MSPKIHREGRKGIGKIRVEIALLITWIAAVGYVIAAILTR